MPVIFALLSASSTPEGVVGAVNQFAEFLLRYVGALAAVGALSMALIEAGKKLLDSRTKFQTLRWTRWMLRTKIEEGILPQNALITKYDGAAGSTHARALAELLQLCTGITREEAVVASVRLVTARGHLPFLHAFHPDPAHALFALDLSRMMGSIQEAAEVALAAPEQFPNLYLMMTTGAEREDISQWFDKGSAGFVSIADTNPTLKERQEIKEHAERFARLRQIIKRKLDGFQLYTGDRWGSWNQAAANAVGIAVLLGVLLWLRRSINDLSMFGIIVISLLGGILSPVAKDLVAALKRVKDG